MPYLRSNILNVCVSLTQAASSGQKGQRCN